MGGELRHTSNKLSLDVASSREVRTARAPLTTRALAPTVETDGGGNGYRIFRNNKLHMQQCTSILLQAYIRACVLRNYECSFMVYVLYKNMAASLRKQKSLLSNRVMINAT